MKDLFGTSDYPNLKALQANVKRAEDGIKTEMKLLEEEYEPNQDGILTENYKYIYKAQKELDYFFDYDYHQEKYIPKEKYKYIFDLFDSKNKKVIGKFKDELNGRLMTENCFCRSKNYAYLKDGDISEFLKCKGITKASTKYTMNFLEIKRCLNPKSEDLYKTMYTLNYKKITSTNKTPGMYLIKQNKKAVCPYDDKRWIADDGITTRPFGYETIVW
jgi:hypothetical protein